MSDKELMTALTYCRISDGELCMICPFNHIVGGECSKVLNKSAVHRIKELIEERDNLSEKIYHLEYELKKRDNLGKEEPNND